MSGAAWYLWGCTFALLVPWTVAVVVMVARTMRDLSLDPPVQ